MREEDKEAKEGALHPDLKLGEGKGRKILVWEM